MLSFRYTKYTGKNLADTTFNKTATFLSGHLSASLFVISYQPQVFLVNDFCNKDYSENILQILDTNCYRNSRKFHGKNLSCAHFTKVMQRRPAT